MILQTAPPGYGGACPGGVYWYGGTGMNMMPETYKIETLPVGGSFHLKTGKDWIVYAGLVNEDTYSIVQLKARGYQGYAWNLYFPRRQQDVTIDGVSLQVMRADAHEIEFRADR
jgi:hypothetical protein